MNSQLAIDFNTHRMENNPDSQAILDANRDHLSNQCARVYQMLKLGKRLTTTDALRYGIGDLRARIRDLIKAGVPVQKRLIQGRYKEYFLITTNS